MSSQAAPWAVSLLLTMFVCVTSAKLTAMGFGEIEDKGDYGVLTTPELSLACGPMDGTHEGLSKTFMMLAAYLSRENKEKIRVSKTRPSVRIVDDKFKGKFCYPIRDAGIDFPTPLDDQKITIFSKLKPWDYYIKEFGEMVSADSVDKRAAEFQEILEEASVTDVDYTKRYVLNFMPGTYRLAFKKTK